MVDLVIVKFQIRVSHILGKRKNMATTILKFSLGYEKETNVNI